MSASLFPRAIRQRHKLARGTGMALALMLAAGVATPALASTEDGVRAWQRGDYPTAIRAWKEAAAKGDPDAQFDLGQSYRLGRGVKQDPARALELFRLAAARGYLKAADELGLLMFETGDRANAMPYIAASAERGDRRAQYLLGIALFNGDIATKDWVRAYAMESLAAQAGMPQAKSALAQMDKIIPIEQRQQAVALEADLNQHIEANRNRQLAAMDLGTRPAAPAPTPAPAPSPASSAMPPMAHAASSEPASPPEAPATPQTQPEPAPQSAPAYAPPSSGSYGPPPSGYAASTGAPPPVNSYTSPNPYSGFAPPAPPAAGQPEPHPKAQPAHKPSLPPAPVIRAAKAKPHAPAHADAPAPTPAPDSEATPTPAPSSKPAPATHTTPTGAWKVQLGAFGVPANAEAMWTKARRLPEIAGHPRELLPTGRVNRLLATGYSEAQARDACHKLSAAGITCLVTKD